VPIGALAGFVAGDDRGLGFTGAAAAGLSCADSDAGAGADAGDGDCDGADSGADGLWGAGCAAGA